MDVVFLAESALKAADELDEMLASFLGADPIFGRMAAWELGAFFDPEKTRELRAEIVKAQGVILLLGTGAAYMAQQWDLLLYCDVTRWEIQQR